MEGVAALALACNITQIVEQAIAVGKTVCQIYKGGSTKSNNELQEYVNILRRGNEQLQESLRQPLPLQLTTAEETMWNIAPDCSKIAYELVLKLEKLKAYGGKRDALMKAAKTLWKKREIKELIKKLQDSQKLLETNTVFAVRDKVNQLADMDMIQFDRIDDQLKLFLDNLKHGRIWIHAEMQENRRLLEDKLDLTAIQINQGLASQFDEQRQREELAQAKVQLRNSLDFPERNTRIAAIAQVKRRGTSWPFAEDHTQSSWSKLPEWLSNSAPIFWIQGKPGSGKSTLMRYLWRHEKTSELLRTHKAHSEPFILTHAFWRPGQSEMEKNFRGMLCSLLYDALVAEDELLTSVTLSFPRLKKKNKVEDWDMEDDLVVVLRHVVEIKASTSSICIFLDGLDEIMEEKRDDAAVMEWIRGLSDIGLVKFCLSSRYVTPWIDRLQHAPQLRLQDLNQDDIELFITNSVENSINGGKLLRRGEDAHATERDDFVEKVVQKADGVFVWAVFAMNTILRVRRTTWKDLRSRLSNLPNELAPFLREMLKRRGVDAQKDRQEAASYFKICLDGGIVGPGGSTRDAYLHHAVVLWAMYHSETPCNRYDRQFEDFKLECLDTRDRIEDLCAGLIILEPTGYLRHKDFNRPPRNNDSLFEYASDVSEDSLVHASEYTGLRWSRVEDDESLADAEVSDSEDDEYEDDFTQVPNRRFTMEFTGDDAPKEIRVARLQFYHRTVMDFFKEDPGGAAILEPCVLTEDRILRACVEANLIRYKLHVRQCNVEELGFMFSSIGKYRDLHSRTITASQIANTVYEVIRVVSQTFETTFSSNELSDSDKFLEPPSTFALFQSDPCSRLQSSRAIDVAGLALECGLPEYFQEYIALYLAPHGMNGHVLTAQYQDYLLMCAIRGNLPEVAIQLVNSGASLYTPFYLPLGAPRRVCAAGDLLKFFSTTSEWCRWQEVVKTCSPRSCYIVLGGHRRNDRIRLYSIAGVGYNFTFTIDVSRLIPGCFQEDLAELTNWSGDEYVGVIVVTPMLSSEITQLVVPLTFKSCLRLFELESMTRSRNEPRSTVAFDGARSLESLIQPRLSRDHRENLFHWLDVHPDLKSRGMMSNSNASSTDEGDLTSSDEKLAPEYRANSTNPRFHGHQIPKDEDDSDAPRLQKPYLPAEEPVDSRKSSDSPTSSNSPSSVPLSHKGVSNEGSGAVWASGGENRNQSKTLRLTSEYWDSQQKRSSALKQHFKSLQLFRDPSDPTVLNRSIKRLEKVKARPAAHSEDGKGRNVEIQSSDAEHFSLPERSSTLYFDALESFKTID